MNSSDRHSPRRRNVSRSPHYHRNSSDYHDRSVSPHNNRRYGPNRRSPSNSPHYTSSKTQLYPLLIIMEGKPLPLCSQLVLKDAIKFLELALIEAKFQNPNAAERPINLIENELNVEKLRDYMISIADPLFYAKTLDDLMPYKYIYRDMWRKLFIISCKLCIEYDEYMNDGNSSDSGTSNATIFDVPSFDTFDTAMYEFGFNFGESVETAIGKMVERVARFGFGGGENLELPEDVDDVNSGLFENLTLGNLYSDEDSVDSSELAWDYTL